MLDKDEHVKTKYVGIAAYSIQYAQDEDTCAKLTLCR